jgi:arginyl-tRNA synthetase
VGWDNEDSGEEGSDDVEQVTALAGQVEEAVSTALGRVRPELDGVDPLVRRSDRADFQSNVALASAKRVGARPVALAAELDEALRDDVGPVVADVAVSGPGFLNVTITDEALWRQVTLRLADPRLGVGRPEHGARVVVDYSAPNIAKEMHVGHLRTTIIGDSLARVLAHLGATVIRQNHLGDWGTQFGMLIQYLDEHPEARWRHSDLERDVADGASSVSALDDLYRSARTQFDADPSFADRARARVVALQAGDETTLAHWREIVEESEHAFREIYARLGVQLQPDDSAGESFYNPWLPEVVDELLAAGVATRSNGAVVVESAEVRAPDGQPAVLMVQKSDGGYGYDTTDIATLRYRVRELKADRILYVVDARQALHFRLLFEAARRMGWLSDGVEAEHVAFGTVLGPDGRPFRTRAGGTVRLMHLIDEAVATARRTVQEREPDLDPEELDRIAEQAGVGAIKYADLSTSRLKDYVFDIERMVSLTGNTSVYLQYAHARIRSILRKAGDATSAAPDLGLPVHPAERALVLALDEFGAVLREVAATDEPHRLCGYLFETARAFTEFYENCPVLSAPDDVRANRLALCRLAAGTLREGLGLLGIAAPERM